ncbi:ComEA family DNA-binding protein [Isoptericola halotolerans]|uniref:helix-hairpin-helix domain-containing protein n=1 Tax=Isoptericola halotolerans TaxID=300560 RepID=UPI00388F73B9
MTTTDTSSGPEAAARLAALRAALDAAAPAPARPVAPEVPGATEPGDEPDPELVDRLRARRSAGHVAAAYSAAHGHPLGGDDGAARSRWALSGPTAVVACLALLVLTVAVLGVTIWSDEDVEDLGVAVGPPSATRVPDDARAGAPVAPGDGTSADDAGTQVTDDVPRGDVPADDEAAAEDGAAPRSAASVVVHVVGEVADPGLVELPAGARVADAVEAAGGSTDGADLTALNLARAVVDGEQVDVPAPGDDPPVQGAPADAAAVGGPDRPRGLVPLNTADAAELTSLPGVGPVIAERIVAWRDENGPFTRVDELTEVSGIGPALLADVRDLVSW